MKNVLIIGAKEDGVKINYYNAVSALGATPYPFDKLAPRESVLRADAIIIPGGCDVNPALYHEENVSSVDIDDELDRIELYVLSEARELKIPVLGICRGLQIMNVFLGGSLIQNVEHCEIHKKENDMDKVHGTTVYKEKSFIYDIYGSERISVNSAHHQAIKALAKGLRAVQHSDDGVIEAVCHESLPFYGVQWHPERMCLANARRDTVDGLNVFEFFLGSRREEREDRRGREPTYDV